MVPNDPPAHTVPIEKTLVVADANHLRQRDHAEQHDFAADDARHRRHGQRRQQGHHGDAAANTTGPGLQGVIQVLGHPGLVEDRCHQHEHRHRDKDIVVGQCIDAARDQGRGLRSDIENGERERDRTRHESQRQPQQHEADDADEDENRDPLDPQSTNDSCPGHRLPPSGGPCRRRRTARTRFKITWTEMRIITTKKISLTKGGNGGFQADPVP